MCIALLVFGNIHPAFRLLIASNRDEFFERPTQRAHPWTPAAHHTESSDDRDKVFVVSGLDLERSDQGTWLGISSSGRFAIVTNFREVQDPATQATLRSRGTLTRDFLEGTASPKAYLQSIAASRQAWGGFNLIVGTMGAAESSDFDVWFLSNRGVDEPQRLKPNTIYGVSNGMMLDNSGALVQQPWPKVQTGTRLFGNLIASLDKTPPPWTEQQRTQLVNQLWELLMHKERAEPSNLPETGMSKELEHALSPIYIRHRDRIPGFSRMYGTRCSTVILAEQASNDVYFYEREWGQANLTEEPQTLSGGAHSMRPAKYDDGTVIAWHFPVRHP
ncbi:hypothetical protein RI367_004241 [Sorochytrium milnesiophthora]